MRGRFGDRPRSRAGRLIQAPLGTAVPVVSDPTKKRVFAAPAAYTITGTDPVVLHAWVAPAAAGSYAMTGTDTPTLHGWTVVALAASYDMTGTDAFLAQGHGP